MPNQSLSAVSLDDVAGLAIPTNTRARIVGVALKSALAGNLTLTGVSQADGSPAAWVIPSGSSAFATPPGSGIAWSLAISYANAGDAGKAVLVYQP